MAKVKDDRRDIVALTQNIRDVEGAPEHVPSAGEALIKDLVGKQTRTQTSLSEQLAVKQDFVLGVGLDPTLDGGLVRIQDVQAAVRLPDLPGPSSVLQEPLSINDLMTKTGLSRSQLETHLSVKPDSQIMKLYKFALSNQQAASPSKSLISQLPDHPLNKLKCIEEEFMKKVHEEKELLVKTRRKHRKRSKKKKLPECGPLPREEYRTICENSSISKEEESSVDRGRLEAISEVGESGTTDHKGPKRPSLWDVKDMKRFCSTTQYGCQAKKLFTVKDGQIVEVTQDNMEND